MVLSPQTTAIIGHGFLLKLKLAITVTVWFFNPKGEIQLVQTPFSSMSRVYSAHFLFFSSSSLTVSGGPLCAGQSMTQQMG